ncbi:glycosyltransferase [Schlesneria paludicola]|uniref:glycosyltransferase n=1 Tax=Schlesneria paludicola TaxID=360056 RepID=UPI00029A8451|nr:glycosyltransferase family 2 protein [Schlesneria paludicola]
MWLTSSTFSPLLPWCLVALWIIQLSLVLAGFRHRKFLKANSSLKSARLPRLSVLVAARNEEDCIEKCVRSLCLQNYPDFEVIAINDRSTDATGQILDRLEREFAGRLRVIRVPSLPEGWFGKTHAMHLGMQFAQGEWFCFTDADCEQTSDQTLTVAVSEAIDQGADMLTLTPQFTMTSIWEKLTVPVCSWLMMVWFQPGRVNNPAVATAYANGAFMLMNRVCFDRVGGWASVRTQIGEDVAIARIAKSNGCRLLVMQSDGLFQTRMYDSIRASWNGWSRIFYGTLSPTVIAVSIARLLLLSMIPTWILASSLIGNFLQPPDTQVVWNAGLTGLCVIVAFQQIQAAIAFRATGSRLLWSLTIPIGHVIMVAMLFRAMLNHAGLARLQWRGTVFHRGQIVRPAFAMWTEKNLS